MDKIKVNNTEHPLHFGMLEVEEVLAGLNITDINKMVSNNTGKKATNPSTIAENIRTARLCAYHGISGGYAMQGLPCPWATVEDFTRQVQRIEDLGPAILAFSAAFSVLFSPNPAPIDQPTEVGATGE